MTTETATAPTILTAQCVYLCGSQRLRNDGPLGAPV